MIFKSLVEAEIGLEWSPVLRIEALMRAIKVISVVDWMTLDCGDSDRFNHHKLIVESMHLSHFLSLVRASDFNTDS